MNIEVNYLAVLLAAVASMVIGFLWYGPLFGRPWMKLSGYTESGLKEAQKQMGPLYGVSFVVALITAYVLTHIMTLSQNFYDYTPIMTGVSTAFWVWLGFILPVQTTGMIFSENKKWMLLAINTSYQLVTVLTMGVIIGLL